MRVSGAAMSNPSFGFVKEGETDFAQVVYLDAQGCFVSPVGDSLVPVTSNGKAHTIYLAPGRYKLVEIVDGEWSLSMKVNGEDAPGKQFTVKAGEPFVIDAMNRLPIGILIEWEDEDNLYGKRPDQIAVDLKFGEDGPQIGRVVFAGEQKEAYYSKEDQYEFESVVPCAVVDGYTFEYAHVHRDESDPRDRIIITLTYVPQDEGAGDPVGPADPADPADLPQTGDPSGMALWAALLLASAAGACVMRRRRMN